MDLATGWAMGLIPGYSGAHLWVPLSYGSVRVWADLPQHIVSHARLRDDSDPGFAASTSRLPRPTGDVVAEITRFTIKRLEQGSFADAPPIRAAEVTARHAANATLSPAEERLRDMLAWGSPRRGAHGLPARAGEPCLAHRGVVHRPKALIAQVAAEAGTPAPEERVRTPRPWHRLHRAAQRCGAHADRHLAKPAGD